MIFYILLVFHFFFIVYLLVLLFLQQNSKSEMSSIAAGSVFKNRTDNELAIRAVWLGIFLFFMTSIFLYKTSTKEKDKIAILTKNNQVQVDSTNTQPQEETGAEINTDTKKTDTLQSIKNISSSIFSPQNSGNQELIDRPSLDITDNSFGLNPEQKIMANENIDVESQEQPQESELEDKAF